MTSFMPSPLLDSGSPIMGSSLFSQSISFMKKADAPKRLVRASKPPSASKTVGGKKTTDNGSKHRHATSSSKPSWSFDSDNSKIQEYIVGSSNLQIQRISLSVFFSFIIYYICVSKPISKCHTSMS